MIDDPPVWISSRKLKNKSADPKRPRQSYHLRWIDLTTGKWKNKAVGTDRTRAEREAALLEVKLGQGTYCETRHVRWQVFADAHVATIRGKTDRADAERTLRLFADCCAPLGPHAVSYAMIEKFVAHLYAKRKNTVATVNKRLRYLRGALGKAVKRGHIVRNPMDEWQWEREEVKIPRALSEDEKAKLLDACPTAQWRTFVFMALTTGCRRGELLPLTWDRVDLDAGQIVLTHTKAKRDRVQPLHPDAVVMLRSLQAPTLRDGGPFVALGRPGWVCQQFRAIVEAAGIARCTIHDLRRTFCTDLARLGVNQLIAQRLAGHASSSTTAKYYQHIDDGSKRDAILKLA